MITNEDALESIPMYDTIKLDKRDYDYIDDRKIVLSQLHCNVNDTVVMESNPSYGIHKGEDEDAGVTIQSNPAYVMTKPNRKISEDELEYGYVQPNEFAQLPSQDDDVMMEPNPSYGNREERNSQLGSDVIITPNPSYIGVPNNTHKTDDDYLDVHM